MSVYLHSDSIRKNGRVAEWLGRGLQNLVQRFESASDLHISYCPLLDLSEGHFFWLKV
jgi:hypothetical protein